MTANGSTPERRMVVEVRREPAKAKAGLVGRIVVPDGAPAYIEARQGQEIALAEALEDSAAWIRSSIAEREG